MNKNLIIAVIVGIVLGAVAWSGVGPQGNRAASALSIDRHFIEQMIPHHDDAITMAELALTRAKRPEIKNLATAIVTAQTKENNQMRTWYQDWYGQKVPVLNTSMGGHGMMHGGMMSGDTDFSTLETSIDFDRDFIREMIPHHQMAVMMASMLIGSTERPEMKKLGDDIIKAQTREIEQMRARYDEWK